MAGQRKKKTDGSTIHIADDTKEGLDSLKVHARQSYDELLRRLIYDEQARRRAKS